MTAPLLLLAAPAVLVPILLALSIPAAPAVLIPALLAVGAVAVLLAVPVDVVPGILGASVPSLLVVAAVNSAPPRVPTASVPGISAVMGPGGRVVLRVAGPLGCVILIQRLVDQVAHGCPGENIAQVPGLRWPRGRDRGGQRHCYDESYTSKPNRA